MASEKIVVGLDIGTTKVCAVAGVLNEYGLVDILGFGKAECDGVSRGVIDNIDRTVEAIRLAVDECKKQANMDIFTVHVGIAGDHIRAMQQNNIITLSGSDHEINRADLDRLRDDLNTMAVPSGMEIIHILPQEYAVDHNKGINDPIGMSGVRLEGNFLVVTGNAMAVRNIHRCIKKADLEIAEVVLQPICSANAVLLDEEREAGICMIDIGGGTTDIAIYENNVLRHTAVIPLGSNAITNDIKIGCGVMKKQAELLKLKFGSAMASEVVEEIITINAMQGRPPKEIRSRTLANIIQCRMEELMELVMREVRNTDYHKRLAGGMVVTGGGAMLPHVRELVEYVSGMDCRIGQPSERLAKGMVNEVNSPKYATAVGLVMQGLYQDPAETSPRKGRSENNVRGRSSAAQANADGGRIFSYVKNFFSKTLTDNKDLLD